MKNEPDFRRDESTMEYTVSSHVQPNAISPDCLSHQQIHDVLPPPDIFR